MLYNIDNEDKRREVDEPACAGPCLSTGAAPILFQTEVIVTPTDGRTEGGG